MAVAGAAAARGVRRLRPEAPVGIADAACLRRRYAGAVCRACVDACPTRALAFALEVDTAAPRVSLAGDCIACGRCHAACPTGALHVAGFAVENSEIAAAQIALECWKSPRRPAAGEGRLRVPCLFGLGTGQIVALRVATLPRPMLLIDRGWCQSCSAGDAGGTTASLAEAAALMREAGLPDELQPQVVASPLPPAAMPTAIPDAAGQRRLDRRAFFGSLLRETLVPAAISAAGPAAEVPIRLSSTADAGARRDQLVASLSHLAEIFGGPLPTRLFHRLRLDERCRDHGVCAANCPTGALSRWHEDDRRGLEFASGRCIACGHCVSVCPESALRLVAGGGYQPVTRLSARRRSHCPDCGSEIGGDAGDDGLCLRCARSRCLADSAFQQLFGAGA